MQALKVAEKAAEARDIAEKELSEYLEANVAAQKERGEAVQAKKVRTCLCFYVRSKAGTSNIYFDQQS